MTANIFVSMASFIKEAKQLLRDKKYTELLELVNEALENDPKNVYALIMKAAALQALSRDKEGADTLNDALKLDPYNVNILKGLLRSYINLRDLKRYVDVGALCLFAYLIDPKLSNKDSEFREQFTKITSTTLRSARSFKQENAIGHVLALQVPYSTLPYVPQDDSVEAEVKQRHDAVYDALVKMKLVRSSSAAQLVSITNRQFQVQLRSIDVRVKQSLSYTDAKALHDRLAALKDSNLIALLTHAIASEDDDDVRRGHESLLLKLHVDELHWRVQANEDVSELRAEIREQCERMVMFAPVTPLPFELAFDWEHPELPTPKPEKPQTRKEKKSKKSQKGKPKTQPSTDRTSEDLGEAVEALRVEDGNDGNDDDNGGNSTKGDTEESPVSKFLTYFPENPLARVISALSRNLSVSEQSHVLRGAKPTSVFGLLLCAQFFTRTQAYEAAIDASHQGLAMAETREKQFGMDMRESRTKLTLCLAQCYTYHDSPKNFGLASELYDTVLTESEHSSPDTVRAAMVGKGLILSQLGEVDAAISFFRKVVDDDRTNFSALNELSWLYGLKGETDRAIAGLQDCLNPGNTPLEAAEIHWRIGKLMWDAGRRDQPCFNSLIKALESTPMYAPAYTYLGLFYKEVLHDGQRAQRCFYKALELDDSQLIAGENLAADFAAHSQWDLVEIVATTVLNSKKLSNKEVDWPYRAMGIVCINQLRFNEAVKYFQHCLRSQKQDIQAWVGLGESYIHSGRYSSAEKALSRALKINPEDFTAHYVLSLAQRETLNFPASAESLRRAISFAGASSAQLLWALADNCLRAAHYFFTQSRLEESFKEIERALAAVADATTSPNATNRTGTFWGLAAEAMLLLADFGCRDISEAPEFVRKEIERVSSNEQADTGRGDIGSAILDYAQFYAGIYVRIARELGTSKKNAATEKPIKVAALSVAALAAHRADNTQAAIKYYQEAIKLESRNEMLWCGYGVVLQTVNPRVSQHCFIRALSIDGRNADTWLNLAALYLTNGDAELAVEAADRALAVEPDLCRAWITQALAYKVLRTKDETHIFRTLEHAYLISENDSIAGLALAFKEFELRPENPKSCTLGALDKVLAVSNNLDNHSARLVMGLLLERRGDTEEALRHLYSVEAWPHVARVQLALGMFKEVLETVEKASETNSSGMGRLSCLITAGLASFFLGDIDASITQFTIALEEFESDPDVGEDVLRMLVEVLYSSGSEEALQVAQDQLFMSIEQNGATLQVTMLLGAFGLLSDDDVVKEAAREELKQLITSDLEGTMLGRACHILHLLDPTDGTYQRAIFQWPTDYNLWRHADKKQALILAQGSTDPIRLSTALKEAGGEVNTQRSKFIDPLAEF